MEKLLAVPATFAEVQRSTIGCCPTCPPRRPTRRRLRSPAASTEQRALPRGARAARAVGRRHGAVGREGARRHQGADQGAPARGAPGRHARRAARDPGEAPEARAPAAPAAPGDLRGRGRDRRRRDELIDALERRLSQRRPGRHSSPSSSRLCDRRSAASGRSTPCQDDAR